MSDPRVSRRIAALVPTRPGWVEVQLVCGHRVYAKKSDGIKGFREATCLSCTMAEVRAAKEEER
jgi:hypothetical protein